MRLARDAGRMFRTTKVRATSANKARNKMRAKVAGIALLASLSLFLVVQAYASVRRAAAQNNYFTVKNIIVSGAKKLDERRIRGLLQVGLSGNIFTRNIDRVTSILESNPVVESASIRLSLPDVAEVSIVERKPSSAVYLDGKTYLMDAGRFLIEEAPQNWSGGPVIKGIKSNARPGQRLSDPRLDDAFSASKLFELDHYWHEKGAVIDIGDTDRIVVTSSSGVFVRLGRDQRAWREKFYEYMSARRISADIGTTFAGYDLSFEGQVVGVAGEAEQTNNSTKKIQGVS